MRIVAGKHRSRKIKGVESPASRATLDKVKESIFQRMGPFFDGGSFLDLFAGSGNMGLEALSRGMYSAVFVDNDYKAIRTITDNIESLNEEDNSRVLKMSYTKALEILQSEELTFDVIYLDPPYDFKRYEHLLKNISSVANKDTTILLETLRETEITVPNHLELVATYPYGIMKIMFLKPDID